MKSINEPHASSDNRDDRRTRSPGEKDGWEGVVFQLEDLTKEEATLGEKPTPD